MATRARTRPRRRTRLGLMAPALFLLISGCGEVRRAAPAGAADADVAMAGDGETASAGAITWSEHVGPLVERRCLTCHGPAGNGRRLDSFEVARPLAARMADKTASGEMPPWGAKSTAACAPRVPFRHDLNLHPDEASVFARWRDGGALLGDASTAGPLVAPAPFEVEGPWDAHPPVATWQVPPFEDRYRCVLVPVDSTEDRWITAVRVRPRAPESTHHVLVFADRSPLPEGFDPSRPYECFGSPSPSLNPFSEGPAVIGGWLPGLGVLDAPPEAAIYLPAGTRIIVQSHHRNLGDLDVEAGPEVDIRWAAAPPARVLREIDVKMGPGLQPGPYDDGAPSLFVPAGAVRHTERIEWTLPEGSPDARVVAVGGHMHWVGVDFRLRVERAAPPPGEPESECLLHIPDWDFNWQRVYLFELEGQPAITLRAGDTVHAECTYTNDTSNRRLMAEALLPEGLTEPQDVHGGTGVLDEMCVGILFVTHDASAAFPSR